MQGRYWVFAFDNYYPSGGLNDLKFAFDSVEGFYEELIKLNSRWKNSNFSTEYDFYQVVDTEKIISYSARRYNFSDLERWVKIHVKA